MEAQLSQKQTNDTELIESFTPIAIETDWQAYSRALEAWEAYTDAATWLLIEAVNFLKTESMETDEFFSLPLTNAKELITALFEKSGTAPKGMNVAKLVELGLITNNYQTEVETNLQQYHTFKQIAEKLFKYDLSRLRSPDESFSLNEEFKAALEKHFTEFTKNPAQNEALKHLRRILKEINYFSKIGLCRPQHGPRGFEPLLMAFKSNFDRSGYDISMGIFKTARWKSFF